MSTDVAAPRGRLARGTRSRTGRRTGQDASRDRLSVDEVRTGAPGELIVVVPLSSSLAPSALRIGIEPAPGVGHPSRAVGRAVRAVVPSRLLRRIGRVTPANMEQVEAALTLILGLERRSATG
ncbi:MAG: type II toxin-antitoxin system PemK/MazF family toxin [Acidimicrobiales bacterium]